MPQHDDILAAQKITELLDIWKDKYPPDVERFFSRAKVENIIHAAAWAYSVTADMMAGVYAAQQIFDSLGLREWTFSEDEAAVLRRLRENRGIKSSGEKTDLIDASDAVISRTSS